MKQKMTARQILAEGVRIMVDNPQTVTPLNIINLRIAARLKWEEEEMGGLEHVQFAYRNGTPIVPPNHCGHPTQLVKRGFIDNVGWPKDKKDEPKINLSRWPNGKHWYATVNGMDVKEDNGQRKWNTPEAAERAAKKFATTMSLEKQ